MSVLVNTVCCRATVRTDLGDPSGVSNSPGSADDIGSGARACLLGQRTGGPCGDRQLGTDPVGDLGASIVRICKVR